MSGEIVEQNVAFIDVSALQKRGLFDPLGGAPIVLPIAGGKVTCTYSHAASQITATLGGVDGGFSRHELKVIASEVTFGQRRFFICPKSAERCTRLYLVDDTFASRQAHGLRYLSRVGEQRRLQAQVGKQVDRLLGRDGREPATGKRRADLLNSLWPHRREAWVDPEAKRLLREFGHQSTGSGTDRRRRPGRPPRITRAVQNQIIERLVEGQSLVEICRDPKMPSYSAVYAWREHDDEFARNLSRTWLFAIDSLDVQIGNIIADDKRWIEIVDTIIAKDPISGDRIQMSRKHGIVTRTKAEIKFLFRRINNLHKNKPFSLHGPLAKRKKILDMSREDRQIRVHELQMEKLEIELQRELAKSKT